MSQTLSRRECLAMAPAALGAAAIAGGAPLPAHARDGARDDSDPPFRFCLNTSTISGQKLPIDRVFEIAAEAGYDAVEPWVRDLDQYARDGGSLPDLRKKADDLGLTVESAIGFFEWAVDDDEKRKKGLEEARRSMDVVRQVGGKRIAAPPFGAVDQPGLDLLRAAERYRRLCELGERMDVVPQVEVWGFSKNMSRLGEALLVAIESGHPSACVLADVYHLHKGGSPFGGLRLVEGSSMHVFHMNDYPDKPPRAEITDAHRVYPGDGVAPLKEILGTLRDSGFRGYLSLELFNRDYWEQDALEVARTGLAKMRAAVRSSLT